MIHDMIHSLGQHHQVLIMNHLIHTQERDDHDCELITNEDNLFIFSRGVDQMKEKVKFREREVIELEWMKECHSIQ